MTLAGNPFNKLIFSPPGFSNRHLVRQMLQFGREIRDVYLWQYPLLPGAVYTYQQMASGREWKVSGKNERGVAAAVEWLNSAQSINHDGVIDYGMEQFIRRRVLDYLCVGRTSFYWEQGKPLRYLDPVFLSYDLDNRKWQNSFTNEEYPVENLVINHPIPMGNSGYFLSPISFIIPTAMLAWLIREHDNAAANGRKIRDIIIVRGSELATQIANAVQTSVALWSGADPSKNDIPVVFTETLDNVPVKDMITRLGIANIPENFNREGFQFEYVNEIGATTGLAIRHFWNSEKATNRALEEVQEARQSQKGPSAFVRSEQRLINQSGCLEQFGRNVRFGFIEEVDSQSQESRAKVIKLYSEALEKFALVFNGKVNGNAFLAWLQSEDLLPADLDLVELGTMIQSGALPIPDKGGSQQNSDNKPTPLSKSIDDELDRDEISMDMNGKIVERRPKVIHIEHIIKKALLKDADFISNVEASNKEFTFEDALKASREEDYGKFKALVEQNPWRSMDSEIGEVVKSVKDKEFSDFTPQDHRNVHYLLEKLEIAVEEAV